MYFLSAIDLIGSQRCNQFKLSRGLRFFVYCICITMWQLHTAEIPETLKKSVRYKDHLGFRESLGALLNYMYKFSWRPYT